MLRRFAPLLFAVLLLTPAPARAEALRMGVLPVLDTLPLRVAMADGLFAAHGLDVELVPFASAMERDTAMASGELDGYFGDMIATLTLIRAGVPMRMVTVSYATTPGRRMFALAASPKGAKAGAPLGYSSTTIMEFLLDLMAPGDTAAGRTFTRMEVKKIPIRMQMLLAGQLGYAILPEPLAALVESRGGEILGTDADLGIPLTVICLSRARMDAREAFMAAYAEALASLRDKPEAHRGLMVRACRVPKSLAADFPLPAFPEPHLPSPESVGQVQGWMLKKGLLDARLPYAELVGD
ncbi:ABC transporter substrate-binding protein [Desulfocurvus sp. DL9XJH121]